MLQCDFTERCVRLICDSFLMLIHIVSFWSNVCLITLNKTRRMILTFFWSKQEIRRAQHPPNCCISENNGPCRCLIIWSRAFNCLEFCALKLWYERPSKRRHHVWQGGWSSFKVNFFWGSHMPKSKIEGIMCLCVRSNLETSPTV